MIRKLISACALLLWAASAVAAAATFPGPLKIVNARDHGAVCDGSTDDTASIQAAIDAAYAARVQTVYLPAGTCKTTASLFLDAPHNLRGNAPAWAAATSYAPKDIVTYAGVPWVSLGNRNVGNAPSVISARWAQTTAPPSTYAFSLCLVGDPGIGNHEGFGTQIKPIFNNGTAIWVGPGNGMCVKSVQLIGPSNGYRGQQNGAGVGIGIAGGSGGASRTLIEDSWVENFFTCYATGANGISSLADLNSFRKTAHANCHQAYFFSQTQNDINDLVEPTDAGGATIEINSNVGRPVHVRGGNLSATSGRSAAFAISRMSSLTAAANCSGNVTCYSFTATLIAPDAYIGNVYNAYTFKTSSFGVVPATLTAFDSSTSTATFRISPHWGAVYWQFSNALRLSALEADMQAATKVYATERATVFIGTGITAIGTHIENPLACTQLIDDASGFRGDTLSELDRLYFNADPGMTAYRPANSPSEAELALYYCAQSFPLIRMEGGSGGLKIRNSSFAQNSYSDPVVIDIEGSSRLYFENLNGTLFAPNVRVAGKYQNESAGQIAASYRAPYSNGLGGGEWDVTPFRPHLSQGSSAAAIEIDAMVDGWGLAAPMLGWHAAAWVTPRLGAGQLAILMGTLPAIGSYPIIDGSTVYSVLDVGSGPLAHIFARSAHRFFSYGQDLTAAPGNGQIRGLSWSYKGQSFVVSLDATSVNWMQAGLGIMLDNGGGPEPYEVTGVYPGLGYMTVVGLRADGTAAQLLSGTPGMTYTGSTIGQQPYSFTQY